MKILIVLGEGGHTAEVLALIDLLGDAYAYHYVISKEDNLSVARIRKHGPIFKVPRPRGKSVSILGAVPKTLIAGFHSLFILLRCRPNAILSTGPAIVVPIAILGKLMRAKIVFVETGSRIKSLSMTGRIMYRWADLFFVQWPQLAEKLPKAIFAGRLV